MMRRRVAIRTEKPYSFTRRAWWVIFWHGCLVFLIGGNLWYLQVHMGAQAVSAKYGVNVSVPSGSTVRGSLYVRDGSLASDRTLDGGQLFPVATNVTTYLLVQQGKVSVPRLEWESVGTLLGVPFESLNSARAMSGFYTVLAKGITEDVADQVKDVLPPNLRLEGSLSRIYPDRRFGGHLLGFLGYDKDGNPAGQYGLEGFYDDALRPHPNADGTGTMVGDDLVLTIDRAVQYQACTAVAQGVKEYGATSGSIVIVRPQTGEIVAMCSAPDFYPGEYRKADISTFRNPVTSQVYEPGSTFKSFTMGAGLDVGKVQSTTRYVDKGEEKIDRFTIRNSDKKSHGAQTMTEVLQKSLNTGAIFVARLVGKELFRSYMQAMGFGGRTGIDLAGEASGTLESLDKKGEIYMATASFGQGITATPIQVLMGYASIANKGVLMKPYVVAERRAADGAVLRTRPTEVRQVFGDRAASVLSGMLAAVVKFGHGSKAEIPGYTFAGKTGTAQVAASHGGYEEGKTIQTFVGFGPLVNPQFVMLVKYDNPARKFAEGSALPTWRTVAAWLVDYWHIPSDSEYASQLPQDTDVFTPTDSLERDKDLPAPTKDY